MKRILSKLWWWVVSAQRVGLFTVVLTKTKTPDGAEEVPGVKDNPYIGGGLNSLSLVWSQRHQVLLPLYLPPHPSREAWKFQVCRTGEKDYLSSCPKVGDRVELFTFKRANDKPDLDWTFYQVSSVEPLDSFNWSKL